MNFIKNETAQKLRGGYYTPADLAAFLAQWVKEISPKRVLEPRCGVSQSTTLFWVNGYSIPRVEAAIRLRDRLGVSLDYLFAGQTPTGQSCARAAAASRPVNASAPMGAIHSLCLGRGAKRQSAAKGRQAEASRVNLQQTYNTLWNGKNRSL